MDIFLALLATAFLVIREMINLKETLTKLLSSELAEKAASEGLVLGGQEIECTIMFTDFAGFSTLTKNMSAAEVVEILNMYFGEFIPIIKKRGGFPDKYIGDAIVAVFGAPVRFENHAEQAVLCSIEMQKKYGKSMISGGKKERYFLKCGSG